MSDVTLPTDHTDPVNAQILSVSEDRVKGFHQHPFQFIAQESGVPFDTVVERIRAMLAAGVIRRVRQTLLANKLAEGALVAWKLPVDKLDAAFDFLFKQDPFSGHVVLRSTDREVSGSDFRLWTTLKVPQDRNINDHCDVLKRLIGADDYYTMQAHGIFALGVGHVRRKTMEPGEKADEPAKMMTTNIADLDAEEWNVLLNLKGDLKPEEIGPEPWAGRAKDAGVTLEKFCEVAKRLDRLLLDWCLGTGCEGNRNRQHQRRLEPVQPDHVLLLLGRPRIAARPSRGNVHGQLSRILRGGPPIRPRPGPA